MELQQRQFQEYEKSETRRKIKKIMDLWDFLSFHEIRHALAENSDGEEATILYARCSHILT